MKNSMAKQEKMYAMRKIGEFNGVDEAELYEIDPETEKIVDDTIKPTGKYHDRELFYQGYHEAGTRFCYKANWGLKEQKHKIPVLIKVDKPKRFIKSPRSKIHINRGYGTQNDISFLTQISNPEEHSLIRIRDFFMPQTSKGEKLFISVEDFFENSESLEQRVKRQLLNEAEFWDLVEDVTNGVGYLNNVIGAYHRDLKPSNILVRPKKNRTHEDDKRLETRITDFANACKIDEVERKAVPTTGGHLVTNPFLFQSLTQEPEMYDQRSEMYAIGATMYYALTGKYLIEADSLTGKAIFNLKGDKINLLDSNGKIDREKYIELVKKRFKTNHLLDPFKKNAPDPYIQSFFRFSFLAPVKEEQSNTKEPYVHPLNKIFRDPIKVIKIFSALGLAGGIMLYKSVVCDIHHENREKIISAYLPYTHELVLNRFWRNLPESLQIFRTNGVLDYLEQAEREVRKNPELTNSIYSTDNIKEQITKMGVKIK